MLKKLAMKVYGLIEEPKFYPLRPIDEYSDGDGTVDRIEVLREAGYKLIDDSAPNIYYAHRIHLIKAIRAVTKWELKPLRCSQSALARPSFGRF